MDQMLQLETTHNWVLEENQRIAVRLPHDIECVAHRSTQKISWLAADILFEQPRLGLRSLVVMSVHLNSKYAKRLVAGPGALEEALDVAMQECLHAGRLGLDIVCGDINMARSPLSYFKYASAAPAASSPASALRRSSALLRAAPLLLHALA